MNELEPHSKGTATVFQAVVVLFFISCVITAFQSCTAPSERERMDEQYQTTKRKIEEQKASRLAEARSYIHRELRGIAKDINIRSMEFDPSKLDAYWASSHIRGDVEYVRLKDGERRRVIAIMNKVNYGWRFLHDSYRCDVTTGESKKVGDLFGGW